MREVSPFWFTAVGVDEIAIDPNASAEATDAFMDAFRDIGVARGALDRRPPARR